MQTNDYLTSLQNDKQNLATKLTEKGVTVTGNETFTELVPKLDEIQGGGDASEWFEKNISSQPSGNLFGILYFIKKIPRFIFNGENANYLFSSLKLVENIDLSGIDVSNSISMEGIFTMCINLKQVDLSNFDTSKCKNFRIICNHCESLTSLDLSNFDFSEAIIVDSMLNFCNNLENLIFGENMGKGFTQNQTNYNSYKQDFSYATKLTHDSLIDVINKLYDLHLTYPNTLYTQQLILGDNKAKLTAAEIAIATNKGWTVS